MMSKIIILPRFALGLALAAFGLNGFFHFFPTPSPSHEAAMLLAALGKTGFFFPFVKGVEAFTGILLIVNRFSVLALVVVFPILVGIALINFFLNPGGIPITSLLLSLHLVLVLYYWNYYKGLLVVNA